MFRSKKKGISFVSILVVLDVVLEAGNSRKNRNVPESFNPCCAGCSSGSFFKVLKSECLREGFNPCCAGCSSGSL